MIGGTLYPTWMSEGTSFFRLPDLPPTWTTLVLTGSLLLSLPFTLTNIETIHWELMVVGFTAFTISAGPLAESSIGIRVGSVLEGIGFEGRSVILTLVILFVAISIQLFNIGNAQVVSLTAGGVIAVAVYVAEHVLSFKEVEGWF